MRVFVCYYSSVIALVEEVVILKKYTKRITTCAIFAAIICVVTTFVAVPAPAIGNVNLGDIFILCSAWLLGPWGAVAACIGACLADLFSGFAIYAPATLVIKFLMAITAHYSFLLFFKTVKVQTLAYFLSAILAEAIMVLGYFAYECFIYGILAASASIVFNVIQGSVCLTIGTLCSVLLFKSPAIRKIKEKLI